MSEAILFPGQGAQFPGMGKAFCDLFPAARRVFEEADRILGFSLSDACWNRGDFVHRTDVAQPGILTTSLAILAVLEERGLERSRIPLTAGLSLGEYTALVCADSLSFADGLRLVRLRGEAMQAASDAMPSSMTSLLGATRAAAEAIAAEGSAVGICSVANLNAPGQVVISGETRALEVAERTAASHGVRRTVRLPVAGGFHSECMRPAARRLQTALAEVDLRPPRVPLLSNVSGANVSEPAEIKRLLGEQVCAPVLWEASMRWALERGITRFLEPGPGTVLAGLLKKTAKDAHVEASVRAVEKPEDLA